MTWSDRLSWAIRPDCVHEAESIVSRIQTAGAGLHRDNLWAGFTRMVARDLGLDELPIDMIGNNIAVVSVVGVLVDQVNPWTANYPHLTAAFEFCRKQADIKAVIVRFKTPGGTCIGLQSCAEALDRLANEKLTIGQNDGGCYSAGYYLASFCGAIHSGATDHIGNIGTVTSLWDVSEWAKNEGLRRVTLRSGPIKGLGILGDPVTDMQTEFLSHLNSAHFEFFRGAVMNGRNLSDEQFAAVSDGRWWLGHEAVSIGITDRVATMPETIELVQQHLRM